MSDIVRLAWFNLLRNRIRTTLAMLGVIVGTTSISLMMTVGWSGYSQLNHQIEQMDSLTLIEVYPNSADREGLTASDISLFSKLKHVEAASPVLDLPAEITVGPYEASVSLRGVDPAVLRLDLEEGHMYAAAGQSLALVIGADALRAFVDPLNPPDFTSPESYETYRPDVRWEDASARLQPGYPDSDPPGRRYRAEIVGVAGRADPYTTDSFVYLSVPAAQKLITENRPLLQERGISTNTFQLAFVRVESIEHTEDVLTQLEALGFQAFSDISYVRSLRTEQNQQLLQLLVTGVVSLVVAAIGIANTMYASVLERRKSIGIMKVLGMESREIRALFLFESLTIGTAGGLIGLGLSFLLLLCLNAGIGREFLAGLSAGGVIPVSVPVPVVVLALGSSSLTAVVAGLYPARKATELSPREAMRGRL